MESRQDVPDHVKVFALDPELLRKIREDLDRSIVGEDSNKLLLFLICASSYSPQPLGAVITGSSSAGKSYLLEHVIPYFPKVHWFTRVTSASLDRLEGDMGGSILVVEELGGLQAQPTLRVWISEGKLRLLTTDRDEKNRIITRTIETKGVPVFLTTTAGYAVDEQTQNRLLIIGVDESNEQTKRILEFQARQFVNPHLNIEPNPIIKEYLKSLLPFNVAVPFASDLAQHFPSDTVHARRDHRKLLTIVKLSAFLHQYQRVHVQDPKNKLRYYILADPVDFKYAIDVAGASVEQSLAGVQRRVLKALEAFKNGVSHTSRTLGQVLKRSQRTARRMANTLVNAGYLQCDDSQKEHVFYAVEDLDVTLRLLANLKETVKDWTPEKMKSWIQDQGLVVREQPPEPTYVCPLLPEMTVSALSSEGEEETISEKTVKDTVESEITVVSGVNDSADTDIPHKEKSSVQEAVEYALEMMAKRDNPTTRDDFIHNLQFKGLTKEDAEKTLEKLTDQGTLAYDPQGWLVKTREG